MLPVPETHPARRGMQSAIVGILVNAFLAIVKGVAGVLGNSYALLADAVESGADVVTSFIVWWGLRVAAQPPDDNHPYGHGKAEPLAGMAVALALFAASALITVESIKEIRTPHHAPAPFTLLVLVGVIVVKEGLFRWVFRVGHEVESGAVKGDAWHHRSDAITSAAAFIGISVALLGGPGYESADDWGALVAAVIIAFNGVRMLRPTLEELTDAAPDPALEAALRETASHVEGVRGLDKCYVRKLGFDFYVDLHVLVDGSLSVTEGHVIAHQVQDAVRREHPRVSGVLVHIEPTHHPVVPPDDER